jgi:hypothetical protein
LAWAWISFIARRAGDVEDEDGDKDTGTRGWASGVALDNPTRAEITAVREMTESFIFDERARMREWSDVGIARSSVSGTERGYNHQKKNL